MVWPNVTLCWLLKKLVRHHLLPSSWSGTRCLPAASPAPSSWSVVVQSRATDHIHVKVGLVSNGHVLLTHPVVSLWVRVEDRDCASRDGELQRTILIGTIRSGCRAVTADIEASFTTRYPFTGLLSTPTAWRR